MSTKLASIMEYIAQQMQIMTKTSIFEQRLSRNEDTIAQILENQKNLVMHQQATARRRRFTRKDSSLSA